MTVSIYTKKSCSFCDKAKTLLNNFNIEFTEYCIGENVTREEVVAMFPGVNYVPILVMEDGRQVNGATELELLLEGK